MSATRKVFRPSEAREDKLTTVGLLAVDVALLSQMLQLTVLDLPLTVSLYLLAIAIPPAVLHLLQLEFEVGKRLVTSAWYEILTPVAWVASVASLVCVFLHFSTGAAAVFLVGALVALGAALHYGIALDAINADELSADKSPVNSKDSPPPTGT